MELVNEIVEARNFCEAWMSVRRNIPTVRAIHHKLPPQPPSIRVTES